MMAERSCKSNSSTVGHVLRSSRRVTMSSPIDHTYHDYATFYHGEKLTKNKNSSSWKFPMKLHKILSDPKNHDIIRWGSHGRTWKVYDKKRLEDVCREHFSHGSFESFTRSVNDWGFKRLRQMGDDHKAYYHECFLRGQPELCQLMMRVDKKSGRRVPDVKSEPNFYLMPPLPDLKEEEEPEDCHKGGNEEGEYAFEPPPKKARAPQLLMQPSQGTFSHGSQLFPNQSFLEASRQDVGRMFHHNTAFINSPMLASCPCHCSPLVRTIPIVCQHHHGYSTYWGHQLVPPVPQGLFVHPYLYHDHASLDDGHIQAMTLLVRDESRHHNDNPTTVASVSSLNMDEYTADSTVEASKTIHQQKMAAKSSEYYNAGEEIGTQGTEFMVESPGEGTSQPGSFSSVNFFNDDHASQYHSTTRNPEEMKNISSLDNCHNQVIAALSLHKTRNHYDNLKAVESVASINKDDYKADPNSETSKSSHKQKMAAKSSECNAGEETSTQGTEFTVESQGEGKPGSFSPVYF